MFDDPDNRGGDFNRLNVDNTKWIENDDIGSLLPPHICWARRIVIYSMDAGVGCWLLVARLVIIIGDNHYENFSDEFWKFSVKIIFMMIKVDIVGSGSWHQC